ncbi:hypothetical protein MSBRW_2950 [Methanosarcina barkeri str. Wiesmoor]|uniref:Uncharacterized protein n=1 Tax=Methanosarcina barkeri str. Wiesmoor TaxID=1434109 RepID=A0A0E3QP29_METBA|nr:hypothetical protein MSBRW_2950 [Methanosarcina barkeri str. Wiesmoor]
MITGNYSETSINFEYKAGFGINSLYIALNILFLYFFSAYFMLRCSSLLSWLVTRCFVRQDNGKANENLMK